jgi:hypothetical protein
MPISTSSPVAGPSPCVVLFGFLLMPSITVFRTIELAFKRRTAKRRVPKLPSRVAVPISTSEGELAREPRFPPGDRDWLNLAENGDRTRPRR